MIRVAEGVAGGWPAAAGKAGHAAALVRRGDQAYPAVLEVMHPPAQLWCLGDLGLLRHEPIVAIVGTRNATAYGERTARELASAVARAGGCVVSGMARGIDAAAHRGALDAGGRTIAVLGTGVDVPYPAAHRALHREIASRGAVISEMPPGQRAFRGCFPRRNRIIAGLARVTVVVEAGHRSGALNTSELARERDRDVAGVPGPIDAPQSAGVNQLIRDGAHMLTSIDDLLLLAGLSAVPRPRYIPGSDDERAILAVLAGGALTPDVIALRTALPAPRCFVALTTLELAGAVECSLGGTVRRR